MDREAFAVKRYQPPGSFFIFGCADLQAAKSGIGLDSLMLAPVVRGPPGSG